MIPYILLFALVMFLTVIAQTTYNKSKKLSIALSVICVLILSLFAGFRSLDVGIDISVYGERFFRYCRRFSTIISYLSTLNMEKGYLVLNYLVYKLSNNLHVFLFVLQLISASIVYIIAYREKEKGSMWLIVLTYLLLWYNTTFNILRQSISVAILLYAYKFIEDKKYIKYAISVGIAFLFHKSSILCLAIPILGILSKTKLKKVYTFLMVTTILILYNSLDFIIYCVENIFPFLEKYLRYFDFAENIPNINWKFAFFKLVMLLGILIFSKRLRKQETTKENNSLLILMAILDVLLYCSSAVIKYGYRTSYFFLAHLIILYPRIDWSLKGYKGRTLYRICVVVLLILYWYFRYAVIGYDGTIPYDFYWR
ncbi:MAG: EpsG family protein [Bacilli bacterium]|nr:EpsG family protein [Bacilli bacterium]